MKKLTKRLGLKKEHIRVLAAMERDRVRGGFITCSYPTYEPDCCGSASTVSFGGE